MPTYTYANGDIGNAAQQVSDAIDRLTTQMTTVANQITFLTGNTTNINANIASISVTQSQIAGNTAGLNTSLYYQSANIGQAVTLGNSSGFHVRSPYETFDYIFILRYLMDANTHFISFTESSNAQSQTAIANITDWYNAVETYIPKDF